MSGVSAVRVLALAGAALGVAAPCPAQARLELDWPTVAATVVERMDLEQGEKVLLVAHPGMFERLIPHLRYGVLRAGAVDLGVIDVLADPHPSSWSPDIVRAAEGASVDAYREILGDVDAAVMMPGATPSHPVYQAFQQLLRQGRGRTVHFHWLENGSAFAVPGQPLPAPAVIDSVYQHALLHTDYEALARVQERFEAAMRVGEVRVTTPLGTDLRFRVGDRPVNRQDGDASARRAAGGVILIDREIELPAGAVRVAPLEETVEGTVVFPMSQWAGKPVAGLRLAFERGRVVNVSARSGGEHARAEMTAAGDAGRSFREFALGFNPLLTVPDRFPWIPYYGYGAGVVRLSLGDNSELGGRVRGGYVRWNFFVDATVTVGSEVWVRDGRLLDPAAGPG